MEIKQPIYKVISALLSYPNANVLSQLDEIKDFILSSSLSKKHQTALIDFTENMQSKSLLDLEEEYIEIFEHNKYNSLYLFEHLYADSKQRGSAMIELKQIYKSLGLNFDAQELPDHIPMFLEYLSMLDKSSAESLLNESINTFGVLEARFIKNNIKYRCLFSALLSLANIKPSAEYIQNTLSNSTKKSIDDEWLEPEAFPSKKSKDKGSMANCFVPSNMGAR